MIVGVPRICGRATCDGMLTSPTFAWPVSGCAGASGRASAIRRSLGTSILSSELSQHHQPPWSSRIEIYRRIHDDLIRFVFVTTAAPAKRSPHEHQSFIAAMNLYLAVTGAVLYYLAYPFIKLLQLIALTLLPLWHAAQFLLLPVTYLANFVLSVLLFPFNAGVLARLEVRTRYLRFSRDEPHNTRELMSLTDPRLSTSTWASLACLGSSLAWCCISASASSHRPSESPPLP